MVKNRGEELMPQVLQVLIETAIRKEKITYGSPKTIKNLSK